MSANSDRPDAAEQTIPSYNGFHAGLSLEQRKSKAYFHMSYNQPPSKSVVNDIMDSHKAYALCFLGGGSSSVYPHYSA